METYDGRSRGSGKQDVRFVDRTDAPVNHLDRDFGRSETFEGVRQSLQGSVCIAFDHQVKRGLPLLSHCRKDVFQSRALLAPAHVLLTLQLLPAGHDLANPGGFHFDQAISRLGYSLETQDSNGNRGARLFYGIAALVQECTHASALETANEVVTDIEFPALHEHGCHRAHAAVKLGLDDGTSGHARRYGLEVEHLGLQNDLLQQVIHALARLGRDLSRENIAPEFLEDDLLGQQVLLDLRHVGRR